MNVIEAHNVAKLYRLGSISRHTLKEDITRWVAMNLQGKPDPYLENAAENDRTKTNPDSNIVWALRDVSFNVRDGEVLGIIGKNGAGKSTLLKILSKITAPSYGEIKIKGRMASLLEVGTGFHPELSGRENIYLNGAILGMTKHEINSKFDEIVEFSGVNRYVDTPVKRYSSGMYVRLAFAVAAHLEPEILVIDEVLAVGDSEFQKKCLGKMKSVSTQGRTVLFVSHNMSAIKQLCDRAIFLKNGTLIKEGGAKEVVEYYLKEGREILTGRRWDDLNTAPGNDKARVRSISVKPIDTEYDIINVESGIEVEFEFENYLENANLDFTLFVVNQEDILLFETGLILTPNKDSKKGTYKVTGHIPPFMLNFGEYHLNIIIGENQRDIVYGHDDILSFSIEHTASNRGANFKPAPGILRPNLTWQTQVLRYADE